MQDERRTSILGGFLKNKWVRLILIIDVVIIAGVIGAVIWGSTKTATINLNITPVDAKIQIDGSGEYYNGSYQIHPGTHNITITHNGLTPKTISVDTQSGYVTTLSTFLSDDDFSFYKLKDNYTSFLKLAEIASSENNITTDHDTSAEQFIPEFTHIMSIMEALPIKGYVYAEPGVNASTAGFTIRDGRGQEDCKVSACLLVNYYGKDYEQTVIESIEKAGYNPDDYQIIYERYN